MPTSGDDAARSNLRRQTKHPDERHHIGPLEHEEDNSISQPKTCHDTPDVYPPPASWTNLAGMTSEEEAHTHNQPGRVSLAMNLIEIVL